MSIRGRLALKAVRLAELPGNGNLGAGGGELNKGGDRRREGP